MFEHDEDVALLFVKTLTVLPRIHSTLCNVSGLLFYVVLHINAMLFECCCFEIHFP
jgi:hypothetical protein